MKILSHIKLGRGAKNNKKDVYTTGISVVESASTSQVGVEYSSTQIAVLIPDTGISASHDATENAIVLGAGHCPGELM